MGFFWDLMQQSKLNEHENRAETLERRVAWLEAELGRTRTLLRDVIARLEERFGEDLDRDGRVG
jgi:hypothetical protein